MARDASGLDCFYVFQEKTKAGNEKKWETWKDMKTMVSNCFFYTTISSGSLWFIDDITVSSWGL